jgi:hypothetical protein
VPDVHVDLTPDGQRTAVQDALNLIAAYPFSGDDTAYKQQLGDVLKPILEASEQGLTPLANAVGNELHGFVTVLRATMSLLVQEMDVDELDLMQAIEEAIEKLNSGQEGQD